MAAVSLENWEERIRDPKVECMSSDEMAALQSRRLVDVVKRVYDHVDFYHKKMSRGISAPLRISANFLLPPRKT